MNFVSSTFRPNFKEYTYKRDTQKPDVYHLANGPVLAYLPPSIRIEENQRKGKVKTPLMIRGKRDTWSKTILTGLLAIPKVKDTFTGDHFNKGVKSFLLIKLSANRELLQVLYFERFMPPYPNQREQLARQFNNSFSI